MDPYTWVLQNTFGFPTEGSAASLLGLTARYLITSSALATATISSANLNVSTFTVGTTTATSNLFALGDLYLGSTMDRFAVPGGNAALQNSLFVGGQISTAKTVTAAALTIAGQAAIGKELSIGSSLTVAAAATFNSSILGYSLITQQSTIVGTFLNVGTQLSTPLILTSSITATSLVQTSNLFASGGALLSSLSTVGRIGFGADMFATGNTLLVRNVAAVGLGATTLSTTNISTSALRTESLLITSSFSSLTTFGLGADLLMTNNNIIANNLSTQTIGTTYLSATSSVQTPVVSASNLTASNTVRVGATILTTTSLATQTVTATQGSFSNVAGEGSGIFNLNALSTSQLTSTVRGLGNIYLSTSFIDLLVNFSTVSTNYYLASCNARIDKTLFVNVAPADNFPTYFLAYSSNGYLYSNANPLVNSTWANRNVLRGANKISWNGRIWVAACPVVSVNDSLKWSTDGLSWFSPVSGGLIGNASNVIWGKTAAGYKWVACGLDSYTQYANIQYSLDGKNWNTSLDNGVAFNIGLNQGASVIANNGVAWLAGGANNGTTSLFTSADGITWASVLSNVDPSIVYDIAWNGTQWLLTGGGQDKVRYTTDPTAATGWKNSENIAGYGNFGTIAWNGKYWFGGGQYYLGYAYSSDGINWLYNGNAITNVISFTWTGTFLAATTAFNGIYVSPDGFTGWTQQTTGSNLLFSGLAFTSNVYPAYQQTNLEIIYDSQDKFFNTGNKIFTFPSSLVINDTLAVDHGFRRAGINCNSPRYALDIAGTVHASSLYLGIPPPLSVSSLIYDYSAAASTNYTLEVNGTTKLSTLLTASLLTNSLQIATALNSVNPILSLNNTIFVNSANSNAGINCNSPSYPLDVNGMTNLSSIKNVVVAAPPTIQTAGVYQYIKPTGGTTSSFNITLSTFSTLGEIAYLSGSPDGTNWSPINGTLPFTNVYSIQYNGSIWVLCCSNGPLNLYSSRDGSNWSPAPSGQHFTPSFYLNAYGAAYDATWTGSNWVAVGTGYRETTVKVSADGINWSNSSNAPFNYSNDGGYSSAITYGNGMLLATAVNTGIPFIPFAWSSNGGYNWNVPASTDGSTAVGTGTSFKPLWDSNNWYIQYNGSIIKSADGMNWLSNSVATPSGRQLTGIAYNGSNYIATSYYTSGVSIQYATQISTSAWTTTTAYQFNSVAARAVWDGSYWYVAGSNTSDPTYGNKDIITRSPNGINWSFFLTNPFSYSGATSPPLFASSWLSTFVVAAATPVINVPGLATYSRTIPPRNMYSTFNVIDLYSTGIQFNSTLMVYNSQKLVDIQGTVLAKCMSTGIMNVSSLLLTGIPFSYFLLSTVAGLETFGYVTLSTVVRTVTSTNIGLATYGYVSSTQLTSTVAGLGNANYVSSSQLLSTVAGLGNINYVSSSQMASTVMGLGTSKYISSSQLISSIQGLQIYISSSIGNAGNNTYGAVFYLNYSAAVTPYNGLQTNTTIATQQIVTNSVLAGTSQLVGSFQTDYTLSPFIPDGIWDLNIFADSDKSNTFYYITLHTRLSGVETLVTTTSVYPLDLYGPTGAVTQYDIAFPVPYVVTPPGTTIVLKLYASNASATTASIRSYFEGSAYSHVHTTFGAVVPADSLTSTVAGLGNSSYISSPQLISTVLGLSRAGYVSSTQLASTVAGLGNANYVSSTQLASTVMGLGTMGYVSTANLIGHVSTPNLLGLVSTPNLLGLVSTSLLGQSISTLSTTYSQNFFTSSLKASTIVACNAVISSITVNSLTVGSGDGYIAMGDVVATSLSTIQVNTNVLITSSIYAVNLLGIVSTPNLVNLVSTANLLNLVSTANLLNHVSTANLLGLVSTANLINHVSTANLLGLVSTSLLGQSLSTLSTSYSQNFFAILMNVSSLLVSSMRTSNAYVSSLTVDSLNIGSNAGYLVTGDIIATSLSTLQVNAGVINGTSINVSSMNGLVSTANLLNLVSTANLANFITSANLSGIVSTPNLFGLVSTANLTGFPTNANISLFISTLSTSYTIAMNTSSLTVSSFTGYSGYLSSFTSRIASTGQLITSSLVVTGVLPSLMVNSFYASTLISGLPNLPVTTTFTYIGTTQTYTVPAGITSISVTLSGAGGGGGSGGSGALVTGTLTVTPGQVITIVVGGSTTGLAGGYPGGGSAGSSNPAEGARGGGGYSAISNGSGTYHAIAGAGGGAAGYGGVGGSGGLNGANGDNSYHDGGAGGGGTQTAGGTAGQYTGSTGGYLQGASAAARTYAGGGGGGGYYGGGSGNGGSAGVSPGGGGGGSSLISPLTNGSATLGGGGAPQVNGYVIITTIVVEAVYTFNANISSGCVGINRNTPQHALDVNGTINTSTLLVNGATRTPQFVLDVNGASRAAIFYSSVTAGGTATLTLSNYFGVYYNITTTGTYTINVPSTQPLSNMGKYYVIRNNTGNDTTATFTGGLGITSPISLFSNASATVVAISTNGYYALF